MVTEDMDIAMENQEVADVLVNAVTNAVDAKVIYTDQTKIEFPVAKNTVMFDLRNQFVKLMQVLQKVDRDITIRTKQSNTKWNTSCKLPTGNEYNKTFAAKQEERNKNTRVVMFVQITSANKFLN
eukprot:8314288-Ditylum_brightwellii.AAC.1